MTHRPRVVISIRGIARIVRARCNWKMGCPQRPKVQPRHSQRPLSSCRSSTLRRGQPSAPNVLQSQLHPGQFSAGIARLMFLRQRRLFGPQSCTSLAHSSRSARSAFGNAHKRPHGVRRRLGRVPSQWPPPSVDLGVGSVDRDQLIGLPVPKEAGVIGGVEAVSALGIAEPGVGHRHCEGAVNCEEPVRWIE